MVELPEQILQHIFLNLRTTGLVTPLGRSPDAQATATKHQTLLNASLVSKACNRAVQKALYHTLDVPVSRPDDLRKLVLHFLRHPARASSVVQLNFDTGWDTSGASAAESASEGVAEGQLYASHVQVVERLPLSLDIRTRLESGLRSRSQDAEVAVLVCLCVKVRILTFLGPGSLDRSIVAAILEEGRAARSVHRPEAADVPTTGQPCAMLAHVEVAHGDTEGTTSIMALSTYLKFPVLQTFRGEALDCQNNVDLTAVHSSVTEVYLSASLLNTTGLQQLLVACPKLATFSMEWGSGNVGATDDFNWSSFGRVLNRHVLPLFTLVLKPEEAFFLDGYTGGSLGSLKRLESLKHLTVSYRALFGTGDEESDEYSSDDDDEDGADDNVNDDRGWQGAFDPNYLVDSLPVALTTLRIEGGYHEEDVQIRDQQVWLLMRDTSFAALKTIRIQRSEPFSMELQGSGWRASVSNRFWQVLKKE